jgi:hypothetical protein
VILGHMILTVIQGHRLMINDSQWFGETLKINFKFENTPFCKNDCIINSYNTISSFSPSSFSPSSFSPNFRIFEFVPAQKFLTIRWWLCFFAKSVKHLFLNVPKIYPYGVICIGIEEFLFHKFLRKLFTLQKCIIKWCIISGVKTLAVS